MWCYIWGVAKAFPLLAVLCAALLVMSFIQNEVFTARLNGRGLVVRYEAFTVKIYSIKSHGIETGCWCDDLYYDLLSLPGAPGRLRETLSSTSWSESIACPLLRTGHRLTNFCQDDFWLVQLALGVDALFVSLMHFWWYIPGVFYCLSVATAEMLALKPETLPHNGIFLQATCCFRCELQNRRC